MALFMHNHHDHHGHDAAIGHVHAPANFGVAFAIATILNFALVAAQVFYGVAANSMALIADAGHNFADAVGLLIAWGAHALAHTAPTRRFTYGFRSVSILSALLNGAVLLVATGAIAWEAIQRLAEPGEVHGLLVIVVAAAGILINGVSAWLLAKGQRGDLNIRGAFLHLIGDAAVSAGVVLAGVVILYTRWNWIDPVASLVVSAVIVGAAWGLLAEAAKLSVAAVPAGIEPDAVKHFLEHLPGVTAVHDLHIWAMSTSETALTAHLVMPQGHEGDEFLLKVCNSLQNQFKIGHSTLQVERDAVACKLAPDHVV
jgi:cobalt-zinc-cadmium efflux system protein